MLPTIKKQLRFTVFISLLLCFSVACTTTDQVKELIVSSNAAMVSSSLMAPGETAKPNQWQQPVADLDQLIAQNEDQATLVNHLRVRQAMILTVHQQDNLATARWKQVSEQALQTERDLGLFKHSEALVWWYKRADKVNPFDQSEVNKVQSFVSRLNDSLATVSNPDLAFYLGTVMTQMRYRLLGQRDVSSQEKQQQTQEDMTLWLQNYIDLFSDDDKAWLNSYSRKDLDGISTADASNIADFRRRASLSEMVRSFCELSDDLEFENPEWKPSSWDWQALCSEGS